MRISAYNIFNKNEMEAIDMRETRIVEFKETITNTFLKTVSAFSNYDGGTILFGVDDDGNIKGLPDVKQACLDIENKINDSITPQPDYTLEIQNNDQTIKMCIRDRDSTTIKDQKEKFKDAIISLARNPYKDNQLVYISNIPDTFKSAPNFFNNSIIPYNDCLAGIQKEIDDTILSISKNIAKKIKKEKDPLKIRKLEQIKEKVENFHKENLYISTIYPYYGNEKNRYTIIGDSVLSFLTDTIGLTRDDAISIKQKLLEHWQLNFEHNSTIKDENKNKKILKEDFTWPIVAFLVDGNFPDIDDCLSFLPDQSIKKEVERVMNDPKSFYHARYEFTNKVLQRYAQFKNQSIGKAIKKPELEFIKEHGDEFRDEFVMLSNGDNELTEYLTKVFLYRILTSNRVVQKVCSAVGVKA